MFVGQEQLYPVDRQLILVVYHVVQVGFLQGEHLLHLLSIFFHPLCEDFSVLSPSIGQPFRKNFPRGRQNAKHLSFRTLQRTFASFETVFNVKHAFNIHIQQRYFASLQDTQIALLARPVPVAEHSFCLKHLSFLFLPLEDTPIHKIIVFSLHLLLSFGSRGIAHHELKHPVFLREGVDDGALADTGGPDHDEGLHQIINLILTINTMSKSISQGYRLSSMVFNFIKGKVSSELTLPHIQQSFKTYAADKANCLNIYRMISEDQQRRLAPIVRIIDGQLLTQIKSEEESNLVTIYVYRLKTLIWYNLPFEECLQELNQQVLLRNQLSRSEMQALLSVLTVSPAHSSSNFNKFIATIFDLLQQHLNLNKGNLLSAYIFALSKIIARSQYRIPETLQSHLSQLMDDNFASIDYEELSNFSHEVRTKSVPHLQKLGLMQLSPLRKRVIYQLLMAKCNGGLQLNEQLPGRTWHNADQLQTVIAAIKSLCVKEPYVEIFELERGVEHELEVESVCFLKKPQFAVFYIEHIFFFVKNGFLPIDEYSICRIIRTFRSFFSKESELSSEYFKQFQQSTPVDLLKLLIILHQFERYDLQIPHFQQTIRSMLSIAIIQVNRNYIRSYKFENWKPSELSLLYSYLHHQCLDILICGQSQKQLQTWLLSSELIGDILAAQKEKKSVSSEYSRLNVFHRFVSATLKREKNKKGNYKDILSSEVVNKEELKELLEIEAQQDESLLEKRVANFMEKFTLLKTVTLLPNIEINYLILQIGSNNIVAAVDCQGLKHDDLTYSGAQELMFTLKGASKVDFLLYYYNCSYHYVRKPSELTHILSIL